MSAANETPIAGENASESVPLTRREALARERAAAVPLEQAKRVEQPRAQPRQQHQRPPLRFKLWHPNQEARRPRPHTVAKPAQGFTPVKAARLLAGVGIVAAVFATVAIPAYSSTATGEAFALGDGAAGQRPGQALALSGIANGQSASTDGYSSESASQVAAARIQSQRANGWAPASQSAGDDYPFWNQATESSGGGLSPLGYFYRECVDFVAWRMNRDAGSTSSPWRWTWHNLASGSAYAWYSAWESKGWPTSGVPVAGAVAWFPYNHVAYVKSVNSDGSVNIEEYNQQSDHLYHARTIQASDAVYLYPPG